jgi:hypothetical protein
MQIWPRHLLVARDTLISESALAESFVEIAGSCDFSLVIFAALQSFSQGLHQR